MAKRLAPAPPRFTTTRKNAASASIRKCAPTHGNPRGRLSADIGLPAISNCVSATTRITRQTTKHAQYIGRVATDHRIVAAASKGRPRKADTLHKATTTGVMRYILRHHGRPSAAADRESRPYRYPKQQCDEQRKHQAEVLADRQELQVIELLGREPNGGGDRS